MKPTLVCIEGGLPDKVAACKADMRDLIRKTAKIEGQKDVDVMDLLYLIYLHDCEDELLNKQIQIDANTFIRLNHSPTSAND
jgi:hypothetical protein